MSRLSQVFRSDDGRPRAGWRIFLFLLIFVGLSATATLLLRALVGRAPGPPATALAIKGLLACGLATAAVALARRLVDRRRLSTLGLQPDRAVPDLVLGFVLSAAVIAGSMALLVAAGWARIETASLPAGQLLLLLVGTGLTVSWVEEIVFRGYLLQNLIEGLGVGWAVSISCVVYGLVHTLNPHASWVSATVIAAIGFLRIQGYLKSRQLWLSMGMHAGWNFVQSAIFGLPVSGRATQSLFTSSLAGPRWLTGGDVGFEAGALGLAYVVVGVAAIDLWTRRSRDNRRARTDPA